ncbi:lipid A biosynthesis acyltransferase [Abyssibacter sp.]|uniref:LpxL/LpxP family acyltransferase n=1 Tax=Abyssibacter sp. TaxID=2320200 RepID=UPI003519624C
MSEQWRSYQERGSGFWIRSVFWFGVRLGRPATRCVLWPIVAYFLLTGRAARRASRDFLRVALRRPVRWGDQWRHFFYFAATILDRLYFYAGRTAAFDVRVDGAELFDPILESGRGALLLSAHFGSFDAMRVAAEQREDAFSLRILMDLSHSEALNKALRAVNPAFLDAIIDSSQAANELGLRIREAVAEGDVVGLMADRVNSAQERSVDCRLFDRAVRVPATPWLLAAVLRVPVILGLCTYEGANRYRVSFELLHPGGEAIGSRQRMDFVQLQAQGYLDRIEAHARRNPYNWFNFYPYWSRA